MTTHISTFRLAVARVEQTCLFELSWGQAQRLKAQVSYPASLTLAYREWQRIYLNFYQANLLGQAESSGTIELPNIDWHGLLVQAEASLLSTFNQWLRQSELYEIRSAITQVAKPSISPDPASHPLDIFLTCTPIELERLPWEAWELWAGSMIQVARTPANIRHASTIRRQRRRPRILVIIGADDRNQFTHDLQAVKTQFKSIAQVETIGWQLTAQEIPELKRQIWEAIAAPPGWDALLFFGHSNESVLTGGELAIAPNTWLSMQELTPQLLKAKDHGLQFALFNSCSGLNIAESLIGLGLCQVVIMREPIHNAVAQHFLIHFLRQLASQENAHQAMLSACQNLLDHQLTYPSAALIPSLFRHPNAPLFQLESIGWKQWLKPWKPTHRETIFTGILAFLSLLWPIQDGLLDLRMLAQAVYRDVGHEAARISQKQQPLPTVPILLVQIDDESLRQDNVVQRRPMDRAYLTRLIHRLATLKPGVIGIDYVLDRPQPKTDPALAQSMQSAARQGTRFVLATVPNELNSSEADLQNRFLNPRWSFPGSIEGSHRLIPFTSASATCNTGCPFAQMLTIASGQRSAIAPFPPIQRQSWLTPVNDLSIPPDRVFQSISASQVLAKDSEHWSQLKLNQPPIVILAPGGYAEAGVRVAGEDNLPMPWVVSYWRSRLGQASNATFTGGEAHAYRVYQLLHRKWVIPIPDLLWIGFAALLGKRIQLHLKERPFRQGLWKGALALGTGSYGLLGLQLYISAGVLCPWLFPSVALWYYVLHALEKKSDA
jgi:hypothetical protein